jgi:hypothetical protein
MKNIHILKWVLVVAIVVVLNLFFNFSIKLAYNNPEFEKYCPQKQVTITPDTQDKCVAAGGAWTENNAYGEKVARPVSTDEPQMKGWCDPNFTCQKNYQTALEVYNRNVFIILIIAGLASLIVGFFLSNITAVSLGLSLGGVLSFIIGTVRYWSNMDDYLRVIILGLALAALIWIGVKKIRD